MFMVFDLCERILLFLGSDHCPSAQNEEFTH